MIEGNRLKPENKYFELYTPQELMELSIALSYARQKLNDQILMNKTTDYRVLQRSVKEQMIKRQALQQLAEMPNSFISKKIIKNLFNEPDAVEQQAEADLAEINGVGGLGGVADAPADGESKSSTFNEDAGDDAGDGDGEEDIDSEVERIQSKIDLLENVPQDKLRTQLDKIPDLANKYTDEQLLKRIEDIKDLLIYKDVMSDKVAFFLDRSLMLIENTRDIRRASKEEVKIEDEQAAAVKRASTLAKNLEQATKQKQQERKQPIKPQKKLKPKPPTKPPNPPSLVKQQQAKQKPPGRPSKPLTESQKQTVVNLRLNKSITGQGYGAYTKPTKKYNLMRGSAMAGNNNKQLLKQIQ